MAIDNDYTSGLYNSYFLDIASLDAAINALDGFWNITPWKALTDIQKENVANGATVDMNTFSFVGEINPLIVSPYNMKFPRTDISYPNGVAISGDEIPVFVLNYVAERSLEKLANKNTGKFYDGRIKKNTLGKLSQEFNSPRDSMLIKNTLKNYSSFSNISPYVIGLSSGFRYVMRT